jgi:hypothetical protein
MKDNGNTVSTFEAIGESSSTTDNFTTGDEVTGYISVKTQVVRKSVPTFTKIGGLSTTLADTTMDFYGVTIAADSAGSVSFGRLVFDITTSGLGAATEDILNWRLYEGTSPLDTADVNIYCTTPAGANGSELQAGTTGLEDCDGTGANGIANGSYKIIVSFDEEKTINAGAMQNFTLKGDVSGATQNDTIVTKMAIGDEATQLSGLTATTNANTGYVYAAADATNGIFTAAATNFSQLYTAAPNDIRNIIWSDKSANPPHLYPTVAAGTVTTLTGSYDWTNGFRLGVTDLTSHTLSKP